MIGDTPLRIMPITFIGFGMEQRNQPDRRKTDRRAPDVTVENGDTYMVGDRGGVLDITI